MKKAFLVLALAAMMFAAGQTQAQTTIHAGYSPETFSSGDSSKDYQSFFVGLTNNFVLTKGLGVAAGAQFRMNMRSTKELNGSLKTNETQTIIDVPILLNYNFDINKRLAIAPFVGPMLSLGITGNTNTRTYLGNTELTNTNYNWYGEDGYMRRFNLYGVLGANFSVSNFNVFAGYRFGLVDLNKSDNIKTTTNGFFVGIGFEL